jgi:predicted secreted protein
MNPFSAFVVFLIIWWVVLFMVLPIGVRGQAEEGENHHAYCFYIMGLCLLRHYL